MIPTYRAHPSERKRLCEFAGCGREAIYGTVGLCNGHYQQHRRGRTLTPLKVKAAQPQSFCIADGCTRENRAHGYCAAHLKQFKAHGRTWPIGAPPGSDIRIVGGIAYVQLSNFHGPCVIDAADAPRVAAYRWFHAGNGYAQASPRIGKGGKDFKLWMHRVIMDVTHLSGRKVQCDHIDGNRLNNRRANLRIVTPAQNAQNAVRPNRRTLRGVFLDKRSGRYKAAVSLNYEHISGGWFDTPEEAAVAARALRAKFLTHHNEARHAE